MKGHTGPLKLHLKFYMATFQKSEDCGNITLLCDTGLSLLAQPKHCAHISDRMGQPGILEAAFQVSQAHRMVTFLIKKKTSIQSAEQNSFIFPVTAPLVSNRILWHILTELEP